MNYFRTTDGAQVTEADAFDERGVLRPGFRMQSRVMLRDGVSAPFTDEAERNAMLDRRDAALSSAWRSPPHVLDAATEAHDAEIAKIADPYERRDARLRDEWRSIKSR